MAEAKTRPTTASVAAFLDAQPTAARRDDCRTIARLMQRATGARPVMWGTAIVGFGTHPITYANGSSLDWPLIAFSPRKQDLVLYIMDGFARHEERLMALGRHRTSSTCLYIKRLSDVDVDVLAELIEASVKARRTGRLRKSRARREPG